MIAKIVGILVIMLTLDSIYISLNYSFFRNLYQSVQGSPLIIRMTGAVICYAILTGLLYYFIVLPRRSVFDAFLLGVGVYGVYDSTNYATLKSWSLKMMVMDTLWGGILFATTTGLLRFIA